MYRCTCSPCLVKNGPWWKKNPRTFIRIVVETWICVLRWHNYLNSFFYFSFSLGLYESVKPCSHSYHLYVLLSFELQAIIHLAWLNEIALVSWWMSLDPLVQSINLLNLLGSIKLFFDSLSEWIFFCEDLSTTSEWSIMHGSTYTNNHTCGSLMVYSQNVEP